MRLATYNLWNSPDSWTERLPAICAELTRIDADFVALQETPSRVAAGDPRDAAGYLADRTGYSHFVFCEYPEDPGEGLAFLCKTPLTDVECGWETDSPALRECGLRARTRIDGVDVALTNVHLNWQSVAIREAQIVAVADWIASRANRDCHEILCGDFNSRPESSVYRFLAGQQTLAGRDTRPWHDLPASFAYRDGATPAATLDFAKNPRWQGVSALELPVRVDWILLQDRWPDPMLTLKHAGLFGVEPSDINSVVPSDHYGVLADLEP